MKWVAVFFFNRFKAYDYFLIILGRHLAPNHKLFDISDDVEWGFVFVYDLIQIMARLPQMES